MSINPEVYGTDADWYTFHSSNISFKMPNFDKSVNYYLNSSLGYAVRTKKLDINQIPDNSCCYISADSGFAMLHKSYINKEGTVVKNNVGDDNPIYRNFQTQAQYTENTSIVLEGNTTSFNRRPWGYDKEIFETRDPYSEYGIGNKGNTNAPVMSFNMKDYINILCVLACSTNPAEILDKNYGWVAVDLHTYCDFIYKSGSNQGKHIYEVFPTILSVFLVPFALSTKNTLFMTNFRTYSVNDNTATFEYAIPGYGVFSDACSFEDPVAGKILDIQTPAYRSMRTQGTDTKTNNYADFISGTLGAEVNCTLLAGTTGHQYDSSLGDQFGVVFGRKSGSSEYKLSFPFFGGDEWTLTYRDNLSRGTSSNDYVGAIMTTTIDKFGGITGFREYCRKQAAYLGDFFAEDYFALYYLNGFTMDNENVFLGIIDDRGYTHGEYSKGAENKNQKQYNWTDPLKDTPWKPSVPEKDRTSDPYAPKLYYENGFSTGHYYVCSTTKITELRHWCEQVANPPGPFVISNPSSDEYLYETFAQSLQKLFNGGYPEDMIASVTLFPYMPSIVYPAEQSEIALGNAVTTSHPDWFGHTVNAVTATRISGNSVQIFKTKGVSITRAFNDFRDFSPYTSMSVTIPFHGTVDINPDIVYNKVMSVTIVTDYITGASTGYVLVNGYPIASIDAQVGVSIPLSLDSVSNLSSRIIQSAQQINAARNAKVKSAIGIVAGLATTATGALTGIATGLAGGTAGIIAGGVIGGAAGASKTIASGADYQMADKSYDIAQHSMESAQSSSVQVSSQSPAVSTYYDPNCKLNITYPHGLSGSSLSTYAKTVGYACNQQGLVQDFTGLSVFDGIRMDGLQAPEEIKHMIYDQLRQGVIV